MRHEKSIVPAFSINQNEAHRQIELEAFVVADVGHEVQGLIDVVEPPVTCQGKGEREIEIGTHRGESVMAKNEFSIVTQQGIQLLIFEIKVRFHGSISPVIVHMVESVMKQFFASGKRI